MRRAEWTSSLAQKGVSPVASLSPPRSWYYSSATTTTTSDMALQGRDRVNAKVKAGVEFQECCGLEFQRVLLLDLLLPEGRF